MKNHTTEDSESRKKLFDAVIDAINIKAAEDGSLEIIYLIDIDDMELSAKHTLNGSDNKQNGCAANDKTGKTRSISGSDESDLAGFLFYGYVHFVL